MRPRTVHVLRIKLFLVAFLALAGLAQAAAPTWSPVSGMQYNHVAYGNILENGIKLEASGSKLGAFGPGGVADCRGVANIPYNQSISYYLTIVGNTNGETITFKLYDQRNDVVRDLTETLTFQSDATAASFNLNFSTTPSTYTIFGNVGVAGATLSYTDGTDKTATSNDSGNYSFTVSYNWSGTVTPSKTGYTFNPANRPYTNILTNQSAQDFTATPITYTISGNAGVAGATLSYTDGTAKTATSNDSGNYSFIVSYNWSGTVTPSKTGYTFNPANKPYTNILTNQSVQNYTATASGQGDGNFSQCDVNGDNKPGLAEVIYILQALSGKR